MDRKLKVGQVGVGGFGAYRRARMRETGLYELVAAYDYNPEMLAQAKAEDEARLCDSYDALLSTPGLEAIVISTGAKFHAEQMVAAMRRGLHVFVEKPLCAMPEELSTLLALQQETGVVVGTGHNDHSSDAVSQTIRGLIEAGELGEIATFEKTTAHNGGLHIKPGDWRGDAEKNPGGMLFQCGVHALHELAYYFGPVSEVFCRMRYDVHTTKTADVALCHLIYESGLVGTLNAYHVTPYRHSFNVFGTKANLYREELFFDEGTLLWQQTTHLDNKKEPKRPVEMTGHSDSCGNLRSFYRAVREGGEPYPSLRDAASAVAAVFAAEESARTGSIVKVNRFGM